MMRTVFGLCYPGSISDKIYRPTYNSAAGERSDDVTPRYLTRMETPAPNANPNLTSGDDWLARAFESNLFHH